MVGKPTLREKPIISCLEMKNAYTIKSNLQFSEMFKITKRPKTICELFKNTKSLFLGLIIFGYGFKKFANLIFLQRQREVCELLVLFKFQTIVLWGF